MTLRQILEKPLGKRYGYGCTLDALFEIQNGKDYSYFVSHLKGKYRVFLNPIENDDISMSVSYADQNELVGFGWNNTTISCRITSVKLATAVSSEKETKFLLSNAPELDMEPEEFLYWLDSQLYVRLNEKILALQELNSLLENYVPEQIQELWERYCFLKQNPTPIFCEERSSHNTALSRWLSDYYFHDKVLSTWGNSSWKLAPARENNGGIQK